MINLKNILIVRTDRIGDVILSLPLAGIIKKHYPDCRVTFLLRNYTSEIAANHPYIDDVIILKEIGGKIPIRKNISILKVKTFDFAIIVYPTFVTALIVFLSRIKIRIGSGYRWYSLLFNKKVFEHRKYAEKHELEYNISLLNELGIHQKPVPGNVSFDLQVDSKSLEKVNKILMDFRIDFDKPVIIIHPGSGGSAVDLPTEKMAAIVQNLSGSKDINIIITGAKNELGLCKSITSGTNAINFAGMFNLKEMTALISLCKVFISNSTGPIHIAAALGKSVVGFYPKILACSEKRWGPYTTKKIIFSPEIDCNNCTREQCERLNCMNSIDIEKVTKEVTNQILINSQEIK